MKEKFSYKPPPLVGVGKTAHTRHNTQNVVVRGIDTDLTARKVVTIPVKTTREGKNKLGIINTREVAGA